eukprot:gene10138-13638_t
MIQSLFFITLLVAFAILVTSLNNGSYNLLSRFLNAVNPPISTSIPFIDAVLSHDYDLAKSILLANSNAVNIVDSNGQNAMHIVAKKGHYKYPPGGIPLFLIQNGININAKDKAGSTPLEISLLSGWQKIAMLLLDNGANRLVVTDDIKQRITCPDCKRVVKQYNL